MGHARRVGKRERVRTHKKKRKKKENEGWVLGVREGIEVLDSADTVTCTLAGGQIPICSKWTFLWPFYVTGEEGGVGLAPGKWIARTA